MAAKLLDVGDITFIYSDGDAMYVGLASDRVYTGGGAQHPDAVHRGSWGAAN